MQDPTAWLIGKALFSLIDRIRAYHKLTVEEHRMLITTHATPVSLFKFLTTSFGLCNAAQTAQPIMHEDALGLGVA